LTIFANTTQQLIAVVTRIQLSKNLHAVERPGSG